MVLCTHWPIRMCQLSANTLKNEGFIRMSVSNMPIDLLDEDENDSGQTLVAIVNTIKANQESHDEDIERDELLEQLKTCFPPSVIEREVIRWSNLPIVDLRNMVETTIACTGGSFEAATLIKELEGLYSQVTQTEIFRRKSAILEMKGASHIAMVQRIEKLAGTDFVTQHLKFDEFMNTCKALTYNIEAVHSVILRIAEEEGLMLPPENAFKPDDAIPIVEGLPADPRIIGYVITSLHSQMKAYHGQVMALNDSFRKLQLENVYLKKELERSREECKASNEARIGLVPFRPTHGDPVYLIRIGGEKGQSYLSLINPDKKPNFDNFNYEGNFENALILDTAEQARRYIDKFVTKKPKMLKRLGGMVIIECNFFVVE